LLVVVDEYFYKTNLFYGLVFMLFFLLTVFYLLLFIRRNRKIAEVRRLIAQDLHDEVGAYLTGISMNIELMKKSRSLENNYFQTIELLGKNALLSLKDSLWSLNSKSDNARELWDRVKTLARETLDPLDIHFSFKETEGLEKIKLSLLEKNYLLLVMKECITNAIKHGDRTAVVFEWTSIGKEQAIVITNGITGGPQSKDGQGLHNIENRMKKIGGSVSFQQGNQLFTVTIKLKYPG
jgi:signal transduction histidine kinase